MAKRNIFLLDAKDSPWIAFLEECFEDTPSRVQVFTETALAQTSLDRMTFDLAFVNPALLNLQISQKLKVRRQSSEVFRLFALGAEPCEDKGFPVDACFEEASSMTEFFKQLGQHLCFTEDISVLVVDDEPEIGEMIRDFLERRVQPAFHVAYAADGKQGLGAIESSKPDVVVLDIKMPVMDGREVYREIKKNNLSVSVIIFFDAISGDEMIEIHKIGRPAVVDKGSPQSSMPDMMALIKKMAYFG